MLFLGFIMTILLSLAFTPFVIKLAKKFNVMDKPNERKVHKRLMPRMGGLAIYMSFLIAILIFTPIHSVHAELLIASTIILVVGLIDDKYELSAGVKFLGQIVAATIIIFFGHLNVEFINLPFGGVLEFGILSIPITYLWILGITNAINLIDGLDGLSAGVSAISLIAIAGMAFLMGDIYVLTISVLLIGSIIGFLPYNFHPAKIFMGDSGALYLGFMISVLSLLGFKNVTFISFLVPIIILGVPISDTLFAIIRRIVNKRPISAPDKSHLHHCLLNLGFTHRQTVILIYAISGMFAMFAFLFSLTTVWGSLVIITILVLALELLVEKVGLISKRYRPLLNIMENLRTVRSRNR